MKKIIGVILVLTLVSCNSFDKKIDNSKSKSQANVNTFQFDWKLIKNNFPYNDIKEFNFNLNGELINEVNDLPSLDSSFINYLAKYIDNYDKWKNDMKFYYYSYNNIDGKEVGIFLTILVFNGEHYSFDLIQFGDEGQVLKKEVIAYSWTAAECIGYQRAYLDYLKLELKTETLEKCYDEEAENNESIDSIITVVSLKELNFNIVTMDTIG